MLSGERYAIEQIHDGRCPLCLAGLRHADPPPRPRAATWRLHPDGRWSYCTACRVGFRIQTAPTGEGALTTSRPLSAEERNAAHGGQPVTVDVDDLSDLPPEDRSWLAERQRRRR